MNESAPATVVAQASGDNRIRRVLVVDDTPEYLVGFRNSFEGAAIQITALRDLGDAWLALQCDQLYDLVVIDLAFDSPAPQFEAEQALLADRLARRGHRGLPVSGQALGLRLWQQRRRLARRYCYLSNHLDLWIESLPDADPEFAAAVERGHGVLIDKATLWPKNIVERIEAAIAQWDGSRWLP